MDFPELELTKPQM